MSEVVKTCDNCLYRKGASIYATCKLGGYFCSTERKFPSLCGKHYEKWLPRPPSNWDLLKKRIKEWFVIDEGEAPKVPRN